MCSFLTNSFPPKMPLCTPSFLYSILSSPFTIARKTIFYILIRCIFSCSPAPLKCELHKDRNFYLFCSLMWSSKTLSKAWKYTLCFGWISVLDWKFEFVILDLQSVWNTELFFISIYHAVSCLQAFAHAGSFAWNAFPYLFPSTPKSFSSFKIYILKNVTQGSLSWNVKLAYVLLFRGAPTLPLCFTSL